MGVELSEGRIGVQVRCERGKVNGGRGEIWRNKKVREEGEFRGREAETE